MHKRVYPTSKIEVMDSGGRTYVQPSRRFTALDGLRGLAALVVLINHCLLVSPRLAAAYSKGAAPADGGWVWWLTNTPFHLVWGGSEAVYVFFVLSGFVLALPFLKASRPTWSSYYPKRLVRLYIPVWGSILFALCVAFAVPRVVNVSASWWVNLHAAPADLVRDFVVVNGTGALNTPLWSLQWEVLFSLLLPVYMVAAIRLRKHWLLGILGLLALTGAGSMLDMRALIYLPMFGIGVLMAVSKDRLATWAGRMDALLWAPLLLVAGVLMSSHWTFPSLPGSSVFATAGAAIVIFAFLHCRTAIRLGEWKPVHWLGSRSFSLYLIHEPVVVSVALLTGTANPFVALAISVPASLLLTEAFFRSVERPSHRLANLVGRKTAVRRAPNGSLAERIP